MEPMMEMFIYETKQILDNVEKIVIDVEDIGEYTNDTINEVFRGMHTIKGSAGMMMFDSMAKLSHALEDLFDWLRNNMNHDYSTKIVTDLSLETIDFLKEEMNCVESRTAANNDPASSIKKISNYLNELKGEPKKRGRAKKTDAPLMANYYISPTSDAEDLNELSILIHFSDECVMENVRAYTLMNALRNLSLHIDCYPEDLLGEDENVVTYIKKNGFYMRIDTSETVDSFNEFIDGYPYVHAFDIKVYEPSDQPKEMKVKGTASLEEGETLEEEIYINLDDEESEILDMNITQEPISNVVQLEQGSESNTLQNSGQKASSSNAAAKMISVNVDKLDKLMDLVGELVVSETMVTRNKAVVSVTDDALEKTIRQHRKIITDMQDVAMSVRMVPLATTFQKMKRIIRDISKTTQKDIELDIKGESTEVDKNIIEKISDPLMHLIRNSCDHGIESPAERKAKGKAIKGTVTLEAKNSGGDVWIVVRDDGKGLDADKIYKKALEKKLLNANDPRPADEALYNYIFMAGFSTKEEVSQFSGRGVGMDVVTQNIEKLGGSISIESEKDKGSAIIIKIPLTLTIINGMRLRVGEKEFILPITAIKESFKIDKEDYIVDPNGNEMILVRGETYSILRLYKHYNITGAIDDIRSGIMIIVGDGKKHLCIFADQLIGEQQVVVKPLPSYIKRIDGISGCAILGDGGISLILDTDGLLRII